MNTGYSYFCKMKWTPQTIIIISEKQGTGRQETCGSYITAVNENSLVDKNKKDMTLSRRIVYNAGRSY